MNELTASFADLLTSMARLTATVRAAEAGMRSAFRLDPVPAPDAVVEAPATSQSDLAPARPEVDYLGDVVLVVLQGMDGPASVSADPSAPYGPGVPGLACLLAHDAVAGHQGGPASRLAVQLKAARSAARRFGALAGRGDHKAEPGEWAELVRQVIAWWRHAVEGVPCPVSSAIGVATAGDAIDRVDDLLAAAERLAVEEGGMAAVDGGETAGAPVLLEAHESMLTALREVGPCNAEKAALQAGYSRSRGYELLDQLRALGLARKDGRKWSAT